MVDPNANTPLVRALLSHLHYETGDAGDALWRARTVLIREIGRRTRDRDLSSVGTTEPIPRTLPQATPGEILDALCEINREHREHSKDEWTDVSAQIALLLGPITRRDTPTQTVTHRAAYWWLNGEVGNDRQQLTGHVLATRGLLMTQTVIISAGRAPLLGGHIRLAHNGLRQVGYQGWWPGEDGIAALIQDALARFDTPSVVRLEVGPVLGSDLRMESASLLVLVGESPAESRGLAPVDARVDLSPHPIQISPPLAGLPLGITAERAATLRAARNKGFTEALLFDRNGHVADLARSTLFAKTPDGWITPPVAGGAEPGPLRDGVLGRLGAQERPDMAWPLLANWALFLLMRSGQAATITQLGTTSLAKDESAYQELTSARNAALL